MQTIYVMKWNAGKEHAKPVLSINSTSSVSVILVGSEPVVIMKMVWSISLVSFQTVSTSASAFKWNSVPWAALLTMIVSYLFALSFQAHWTTPAWQPRLLLQPFHIMNRPLIVITVTLPSSSKSRKHRLEFLLTYRLFGSVIFVACYWMYCGEGKCTRSSAYGYKCECNSGYQNLLNISVYPCYSECKKILILKTLKVID